MDLYEAIFRRKSTRQYDMRPLPDETFFRVEAIVGQAGQLYETGLRVHLVREGTIVHGTFKGVISSYVKVIAPHYLVVSSDEVASWRENSGYAVEQVVLEMTRMGLATCWMGGPADREALRGPLGIRNNQAIGVFVAFGRPAAEGDQYRGSPAEARRKLLSEIVIGRADDRWTKLLEAARLAPSAVNSQPWRFFVDGARADLYIAKPNPVAQRMYGALNPVDAGIALAHVAIASGHWGIPIKIERLQAPGRKGHTYVSSISLQP
jgi:nitroreductase